MTTDLNPATMVVGLGLLAVGDRLSAASVQDGAQSLTMEQTKLDLILFDYRPKPCKDGCWPWALGCRLSAA
ncbi:hypothetical protein [Dyadobacter jejuensis]|uniref:hypothetical protein n=1 Tax=Dyadobacter jejuensis TaxID=1082580 RepID=UPI0011B24E7E|nr:hypothetical protein [Dyadobacter jejuensis]